MNNEPVAELLVNDGEPWGCRYSDEGTLFNADGSRMDGWIPLYTHPVKEKGLPRSSPSPMNQAYLTGKNNYTPIAWSCWSEGMEAAIITTTEPDMYGWQSIIPLFTHPVKELTDEEIEELWYDPRFIGDPVAFGKAVLRATQNIPLQTDEEICKKCDALTERAILRKAQEK